MSEHAEWCVRLFRFPPLTSALLTSALTRREVRVGKAEGLESRDIALVLTSPGMDDLDVEIGRPAGNPAIVALSQGPQNPPLKHANLRALITMQTSLDDLASIVTAVAAGEEPDVAPSQQRYRLTPRELQIMELLATGQTNQAVADALHISTHTVRSHVQSAMGKLEVKSRVAAVVRLQEAGLITGWPRSDQP